jgi:hypothetical protein
MSSLFGEFFDIICNDLNVILRLNNWIIECENDKRWHKLPLCEAEIKLINCIWMTNDDFAALNVDNTDICKLIEYCIKYQYYTLLNWLIKCFDFTEEKIKNLLYDACALGDPEFMKFMFKLAVSNKFEIDNRFIAEIAICNNHYNIVSWLVSNRFVEAVNLDDMIYLDYSWDVIKKILDSAIHDDVFEYKRYMFKLIITACSHNRIEIVKNLIEHCNLRGVKSSADETFVFFLENYKKTCALHKNNILQNLHGFLSDKHKAKCETKIVKC